MNRRDLIIISALINAGLLIVLFATALKPSGSVSEAISSAPAEIPVPVVERKARTESIVASGDEVDQVLKEFAARAMADSVPSPVELSGAREVEITPSFAPIATQKEEKASPPAPSFAEELAAQYPSQVTLPQPAKKRETAPKGDFLQVQVQKGDFLDRIARRHGTTVNEIMRANNLSSTNLKIGQLLNIPTKKAKAAAPVQVTTTSSDTTYVVQDGDNPWTIARKNQITVSQLLSLNGLDDRTARKLRPGDRLRIR